MTSNSGPWTRGRPRGIAVRRVVCSEFALTTTPTRPCREIAGMPLTVTHLFQLSSTWPRDAARTLRYRHRQPASLAAAAKRIGSKAMHSAETTYSKASTASEAPPVTSSSRTSAALPWLKVVWFTYLLLVAVAMIGGGFKLAAGGQARSLFEFANNPITGVVIGLVATALVQSSSTVSSITVGLVAGGMPVATAVPIIMGANIGTTVTNTLVSLGHLRQPEEFRRAFAAATVHDFFNLLCVTLFLPLEILFHPLERMAGVLSGALVSDTAVNAEHFNPIEAVTKPLVKLQAGLLSGLGDAVAGSIIAIVGVALILYSITRVGQVLKKVMVGRAKHVLHSAIGRGPIRGIFTGTIITVLVQSSSTTTSLTVPLVGSGVFRVREIYPFVLGANIGTCVTALIAALGITGLNQGVALQIALVHLIYNVLGVIILYGTPGLRSLPIKLAEGLAAAGARHRLWVAAYLLGTFFIIPGILIVVLS